MGRSAPSPIDGNQLVLLFGMPRSGTTWLGKLFDSHPHVLYRHEPDTWRPLDMPRTPEVASWATHTKDLLDFVGQLPHMNALRVSGKRPLFRKAYASRMRRTLMTASIEAARVGSRVWPNFPLFLQAKGEDDPSRRIVWKSIESLGRLALAINTMKDAAGIHIVRHPCGYIGSVKRGIASRSFTNSNADNEVYGFVKSILGTSLAERLGLGSDFENYLYGLTPEERLAWQWVVMNEQAFEACNQMPNYTILYYEELCRDPQAELQRVFDFCNLPMSEQTREFVALSTGRSRDDYYSVFKDPEVVAWRWRDELEPETVARVMNIVALSRVGEKYVDMSPPDSTQPPLAKAIV